MSQRLYDRREALQLAAAPVLALLLADKDTDTLQGTWLATAAERDGKAADDVKGHVLTFKGDKFVIKLKDKVLFEGTFSIDAGKKPATIDFKHTDGKLKGKTWKGIYQVDGDALKTCDNAPDLDKDRPTEFKAPAKSGYVAITFKREK